MYAGYLQVFSNSPFIEIPHPFERDGGGLDDLRAEPSVLQNFFLD